MIMMIMVMLLFASQRSENRFTVGSRTAPTEAACAEKMLKISTNYPSGRSKLSVPAAAKPVSALCEFCKELVVHLRRLTAVVPHCPLLVVPLCRNSYVPEFRGGHLCLDLVS